jgi:Flp pilus assembly protein TadD
MVLASRPHEAITELRGALELDSEYGAAILALAWGHLACGDFAAAVDVLEHAPVSAASFAGHLGYARGRLGDLDEAHRIVRALLQRFPGPWVPGVDVGAIYNGLGDSAAAALAGTSARSSFVRRDVRC